MSDEHLVAADAASQAGKSLLPPVSSGFGVNTYSYTLGWSVQDCVGHLSTRGFRRFELMMYPGHLWPEDIDLPARRELRQRMADTGLTVTTLNMPNIDVNIAAANPRMRAASLALLHEIVLLAGDLGAGGVVIAPGKTNPLMPMPQAQAMDHFHAALDHLVPLAAEVGTSICVENMPFAFLPKAQELVDAIEEHGDARVGVIYDVANGHFVGEDIAIALKTCASRLREVHLSDTDTRLYRHSAVGLGTVDFAALPEALAAVGFQRPPLLEIIDEHPDEAIERSVHELHRLGWSRGA